MSFVKYLCGGNKDNQSIMIETYALHKNMTEVEQIKDSLSQVFKRAFV